jgi:hypothetical protein
VVAKAIVPSYQGSSSYLLLTKYNNYADPGIGGNGRNYVAVTDPNNSMADIVTGVSVMNVVIEQIGPTTTRRRDSRPERFANGASIAPPSIQCRKPPSSIAKMARTISGISPPTRYPGWCRYRRALARRIRQP